MLSVEIVNHDIICKNFKSLYYMKNKTGKNLNFL